MSLIATWFSEGRPARHPPVSRYSLGSPKSTSVKIDVGNSGTIECRSEQIAIGVAPQELAAKA